MPEFELRERRILVVEDEYMLADEVAKELAKAGAVVVGPVGTVTGALQVLETEADIDGAALDINLRGEMAYVVAETLAERGIPFVFMTGYDACHIPPRFEGVPRCEKPVKAADVGVAIGKQIDELEEAGLQRTEARSKA